MALANAILMYGDRASQPAASSANNGVYYRVTDEGNIVEQSNGTTWVQLSGGAGSGDVTASGTLTSNAVLVGGGTTVAAALASLGTAGHPLVSAGAGSPPAFGTIVLATAVTNAIAVPRYIVCAADESVANDTLQNDDELSFAVGANEVWVVEGWLQFSSGASATPDVKVGWTIPTSATLTMNVLGRTTTATAPTDLTLGAENLASSPAAFARGVTANTVSPFVFTGVLRTGANSGTAQLQWAQNTTTGGTPTVRESDSWMRYTRIA